MLAKYKAASGRFIPVWTLEIQTLPDETDRLLDAVMQVTPLRYGRYQRNASVSAIGSETTQPEAGSTTSTHVGNNETGQSNTYPMVELKFSIDRDLALLERVMDALLHMHHYEEPIIYVREDWASRSSYDPNNTNPNRWWNNGRGLPQKMVG